MVHITVEVEGKEEEDVKVMVSIYHDNNQWITISLLISKKPEQLNGKKFKNAKFNGLIYCALIVYTTLLILILSKNHCMTTREFSILIIWKSYYIPKLSKPGKIAIKKSKKRTNLAEIFL
jgi:hypothetical protein